jgi:hypothetical protein
LAPSFTLRQHSQTFSSPCACERAFRLPHALHIELPFNGFLGISNTLLSLGFGILLRLRWILLGFWMLILLVVGLTERAPLVLSFSWIFSSWSSRKQSSIAQATIEAEYVAAASYCSQILWIVHTMRGFGMIFERVPLMCDNTSAISVAKNPVFQKRMRHLERRHHFPISC